MDSSKKQKTIPSTEYLLAGKLKLENLTNKSDILNVANESLIDRIVAEIKGKIPELEKLKSSEKNETKLSELEIVLKGLEEIIENSKDKTFFEMVKILNKETNTNPLEPNFYELPDGFADSGNLDRHFLQAVSLEGEALIHKSRVEKWGYNPFNDQIHIREMSGEEYTIAENIQETYDYLVDNCKSKEETKNKLTATATA